MSEERLVSLFDLFSNDIAVHEYFEPKLRDFLVGKVVVFGLLLLLSEEFSNFLEISIREGMFSLNDVINLVNVGFVEFSELPLHLLLVFRQLFIKSPLLNEVAVDGNGLDLFLESGKQLDLGFNLLLDVDLYHKQLTSSYSSQSRHSSESSSAHPFSHFLSF